MDVRDAAVSFARLLSELYLCLYRRLEVREWRPSQEALMVLRHLAGTGPLTVTEAARHFDRSQAAISELIRRLRDRGLLASMADERDRRRHLVWLTDAGQETLRRSTQVLSPVLLENALGQLAPEERTQLLQLLARLVKVATLSPQKDEESNERPDDSL